MVSEEELIDLILSSRFVVLPLNDYAISAGQNTMIETMALGRPLIVTSNMATIEYATHGDTALFFQAQDVKDLQKQIQFLVQNPKIAEKMGYRAREAIRAFPDKEMAILFKPRKPVVKTFFQSPGKPYPLLFLPVLCLFLRYSFFQQSLRVDPRWR